MPSHARGGGGGGGTKVITQSGSGALIASVLGKKKVPTVELVYYKGQIVCVCLFDNGFGMCGTVF